MKKKMRCVLVVVALAMIVHVSAMPQVETQKLTVSGYSGSLPITQINGRHYVEVEALARVMNGALSVEGNQITLTLHAAGGGKDRKSVV
jgi:hypothetical protein